MKKGLVLIGMPGSGKSTVGVLLAKRLCYNYVDTDLIIQDRAGKSLAQLLMEEGVHGFIAREKEAILSIDPRGHVVATGGSAVLDPEAMHHLKAGGFVVYLDVPVHRLERRIRNFDTRGIVREQGQTLRDLASVRDPLYLNYADHVIRAGWLRPDELAERIASAFRRAKSTFRRAKSRRRN